MEITALEQALKETVFVFAGYGVAVLSVAILANIAIPTALAQMRKWKMNNGECRMRRNILHSPFYILHLLIPLSFAGVMIGHGSEKAGVESRSNAGLGDEPSTSLVNAGLEVEPSTSLVEPSTSLVEPSTSLVEPSSSMVASLVRHCEVVGASSRPQSSVALNEPFSRIEPSRRNSTSVTIPSA